MYADIFLFFAKVRPSLKLSSFAVFRPSPRNTPRLKYFFLLLSQKPCRRVHLFRIAELIIFPGINYQDFAIWRHLTTTKQHKFIRLCKKITSPYCRPSFSRKRQVFSAFLRQKLTSRELCAVTMRMSGSHFSCVGESSFCRRKLKWSHLEIKISVAIMNMLYRLSSPLKWHRDMELSFRKSRASAIPSIRVGSSTVLVLEYLV